MLHAPLHRAITPRLNGCPASVPVLLACLVLLSPRQSHAQLLTRYLPQSVPGYQLDPTLAVLQNGGPDYSNPGVRVGDFVVRPGIDETFGYNDNPLGLVDARSSPVIGSAGSVSGNSDWSRDSLGASVNVDDLRYTDLPIANQTSYSAFAGGRLDIGRDSLDVSGGRLSTYLSPTDVLASGLSAPVPYSSNDFRVAYTAPFGRLTVTPSADFTTYDFGRADNGASFVDDSALDKNQVAAGIAASYELSPGHNLVAAFQQTNAYLLHRPGGAGSHYNDSLVLAGLDYDTHRAFRYDILLGYEIRSWSSIAQPTRETPAVEISITWRPTLLTTINAAGVRHLSDASYDITNNLAYSEGKLVLFHELYRNVILSGNFDVQAAEGGAQEGGNRTSLTGGVGATYLVNRKMRINLDYQFITGNGYDPALNNLNANTLVVNTRNFDSNLVQLSLHFGF